MAIVETAAMWALEGLVKGLGQRLANYPGQKVSLRTIELSVQDIRTEQQRISASQQEMQQAITIAYRELQSLVAENRALRLRRDDVEFKPTHDLPTVGSAMFELDAQIDALRRRNTPHPSQESATNPPDGHGCLRSSEPQRPPSVLDGLDQEIANLRAQKGEG